MAESTKYCNPEIIPPRAQRRPKDYRSWQRVTYQHHSAWMRSPDTHAAELELHEAKSLELTYEVKFRTLARRWRTQTALQSSLLKKVMHPDYQRIIGLGPVAIPLILREMQQRPGHWFWALDALTQGEAGLSPVRTIPEAHQAWLSWGHERDIL